MSDGTEELDQQVGKRFLVIEVNDESAVVTCDPEGFSSHEVLGLGVWLETFGRSLMEDEFEEDE